LVFLGAHYAYLGKWVTQIFYWLTLGGFGIWAIIDLFTLSGKVEQYNTNQELKTIRAATMANSLNLSK